MTPDHSSRELVDLLSVSPSSWDADVPPVTSWREAAGVAQEAYDAWRAAPGVDAYVVYLAAEDRADAAQDELASWIKAGGALVPATPAVTVAA